MKNLIKIAASSIIALVGVFYINYKISNPIFVKENLIATHKTVNNNISKFNSTEKPNYSQEFKNKDVIEVREGFISPCFHHEQTSNH